MKNKWKLCYFLMLAAWIFTFTALILAERIISIQRKALNPKSASHKITREEGYYESLFGGVGLGMDIARKGKGINDDTLNHNGELIYFAKPYGSKIWTTNFLWHDSTTHIEFKLVKNKWRKR